MSPDLRSQPLWLFIAAVFVLAIVGLAVAKYREYAAQQGMMDQRKRR